MFFFVNIKIILMSYVEYIVETKNSYLWQSFQQNNATKNGSRQALTNNGCSNQQLSRRKKSKTYI